MNANNVVPKTERGGFTDTYSAAAAKPMMKTTKRALNITLPSKTFVLPFLLDFLLLAFDNKAVTTR